MKDKQNHFFNFIAPEKFKEAKTALLEYMKSDNTTAVRYQCHFTLEVSTHFFEKCNIFYSKLG